MKRANMEANEGKYNDLLNKQILKVSWLLHQSLLSGFLFFLVRYFYLYTEAPTSFCVAL